jgi:hypothetical protein
MANPPAENAGNSPHADESADELTSPVSSKVARPENIFSEAGGAAVAALLNLLRLLGAELVLVRGSDNNQFDRAVRAKLCEFTSPTANKEAREVGLAQARHLVEQVLAQIRAQAELKKSLGRW